MKVFELLMIPWVIPISRPDMYAGLKIARKKRKQRELNFPVIKGMLQYFRAKGVLCISPVFKASLPQKFSFFYMEGFDCEKRWESR